MVKKKQPLMIMLKDTTRAYETVVGGRRIMCEGDCSVCDDCGPSVNEEERHVTGKLRYVYDRDEQELWNLYREAVSRKEAKGDADKTTFSAFHAWISRQKQVGLPVVVAELDGIMVGFGWLEDCAAGERKAVDANGDVADTVESAAKELIPVVIGNWFYAERGVETGIMNSLMYHKLNKINQ